MSKEAKQAAAKAREIRDAAKALAKDEIAELSKECAKRKKRELKFLKKAKAAEKAWQDYETARQKTNSCVRKAKDKLTEFDARIEVKCLFCVKKVENVDTQDVCNLLEQYDNLRCEGFHCSIGTHKKRVHNIIGDQRWSCCEMPYSESSKSKLSQKQHLYHNFKFNDDNEADNSERSESFEE